MYIIDIAKQRDQADANDEENILDSPVFRNTEVLAVRDGKFVNVTIQFGGSRRHEASHGRFVGSS